MQTWRTGIGQQISTWIGAGSAAGVATVRLMLASWQADWVA